MSISHSLSPLYSLQPPPVCLCGSVSLSRTAAAVWLTSTKQSINLQLTHSLLSLIWQSAHYTGAQCFVTGLLCFYLFIYLLAYLCVALNFWLDKGPSQCIAWFAVVIELTSSCLLELVAETRKWREGKISWMSVLWKVDKTKIECEMSVFMSLYTLHIGVCKTMVFGFRMCVHFWHCLYKYV